MSVSESQGLGHLCCEPARRASAGSYRWITRHGQRDRGGGSGLRRRLRGPCPSPTERRARASRCPIINDALGEGDETLNLVLSNPRGGATLGASEPFRERLTIRDNDISVSLSTGRCVGERGRDGNVPSSRVIRTGGTNTAGWRPPTPRRCRRASTADARRPTAERGLHTGERAGVISRPERRPEFFTVPIHRLTAAGGSSTTRSIVQLSNFSAAAPRRVCHDERGRSPSSMTTISISRLRLGLPIPVSERRGSGGHHGDSHRGHQQLGQLWATRPPAGRRSRDWITPTAAERSSLERESPAARSPMPNVDDILDEPVKSVGAG